MLLAVANIMPKGLVGIAEGCDGCLGEAANDGEDCTAAVAELLVLDCVTGAAGGSKLGTGGNAGDAPYEAAVPKKPNPCPMPEL